MDKRLLGYINWALLACMLLLYFTGVANLYSASGTRVETGFAFESFYQRQLVWGLCGLGCMLLTTLFDYRQLRNLAWPAYLIFLVLLMLVPLVGSTFYGAKRWISFGLFTIQPSEPIKIAVLILVARLLARDSQPLGWKNFFSVLAVGLVPVVFILKQPDLGTAMMVLLIMGGMILFHGLRRYVLGTCLLAVPGVAALMWCVLMHDYQKQRVLTFLNPGDDPLGAGQGLHGRHDEQAQRPARAPLGLCPGCIRRGMGLCGLRGPGDAVLPVPAVHLLHGGPGQGPFRQHAGRGGLLLLFLADMYQYGHGHRAHARGGHPPALHQLRRQCHGSELHITGHRA